MAEMGNGSGEIPSGNSVESAIAASGEMKKGYRGETYQQHNRF